MSMEEVKVALTINNPIFQLYGRYEPDYKDRFVDVYKKYILFAFYCYCPCDCGHNLTCVFFSASAVDIKMSEHFARNHPKVIYSDGDFQVNNILEIIG